MTQDAELKNYQLQWKTEKGGGRVSWDTEQTRPDDDDDASFFFIIPIKKTLFHTSILFNCPDGYM